MSAPQSALPRTILYTGKGGVGKTSVAAATARRCAAAGLRTVVLSTDPAHSLSDSFETPLGEEPTPIGERLWGQEVQAQREMERNWGSVQRWLGSLLADRGVMDIAAEELTVPPGMDELFSLLQIKSHRESGEFEAIVVDCAPTGETLRLLSFPDIARWWLEKVFPWERRLVSAARPIARTFLDVPLPDDEVFDDIQHLVRNLIAMNEILRDRDRATIRLVMNADRMVIREAQRTFAYLNLYGYLTDAVIVNRLFPADVADGYFRDWRERQQEHLRVVEEGFAPVPVLTARYFDEEVLGARMLDRLAAELFEQRPPEAILHSELAHELVDMDGRTSLRIRIPFTGKDELRLRKVGPELIVTAGREKRTIILPPALSRHRPAGASFEGGVLTIGFEDEPEGRPAAERDLEPLAGTAGREDERVRSAPGPGGRAPERV
jgi:arsenite/tail-anchored protein-transporting ATPase